jgi:hemoglobin
MGITDAEFDALVEDLVRSLDRFAVPAREQNELLGALDGMRGDIVEN